MEIQYFGHSSFQIKTKQGTVVCDPYPSKNSSLGLAYPKGIKADIVTISHDHFDHNAISEIQGTPFLIKEPGEYEIKGMTIFGIQSYHDENHGDTRGSNTIFLIEAEGFSVCHLGDLGHILEEEQVNELDEVDILLIPIGGEVNLSAKKAVEVISQIEPKIVIPMHYKVPGNALPLDELSPFLQEIGQESVVPQDKYTVKSHEELGEELQVVVLNKKS